jgi:hypothetical protein
MQRLLLATLMLAACGNVGGDCMQQVTKTLSIATPADPPLQLRVDQCRVDVDACSDLCSLAVQRANLSVPLDTCSVKFLGDSEVQLDIKYQDYTGGIGCPGPQPQPGPLPPTNGTGGGGSGI